MAVPKPSEAHIVVTHHEDGRMLVTFDGKPIPGVIEAMVTQDGRYRSILQLSITGLAFRMETSPLTTNQARQERQVDPETPSDQAETEEK